MLTEIYTGRFKSSKYTKFGYSIVRGDIHIQIPINTNHFNSDVILKYTGLWHKKGEIAIIPNCQFNITDNQVRTIKGKTNELLVLDNLFVSLELTGKECGILTPGFSGKYYIIDHTRIIIDEGYFEVYLGLNY